LLPSRWRTPGFVWWLVCAIVCLFQAYTAAHAPLVPAPKDLLECAHVPHLWRRNFCGLIVGLDRGVGLVTAAAEAFLGDETVVIFSSDNGGKPASHAPLFFGLRCNTRPDLCAISLKCRGHRRGIDGASTGMVPGASDVHGPHSWVRASRCGFRCRSSVVRRTRGAAAWRQDHSVRARRQSACVRSGSVYAILHACMHGFRHRCYVLVAYLRTCHVQPMSQ